MDIIYDRPGCTLKVIMVVAQSIFKQNFEEDMKLDALTTYRLVSVNQTGFRSPPVNLRAQITPEFVRERQSKFILSPLRKWAQIYV